MGFEDLYNKEAEMWIGARHQRLANKEHGACSGIVYDAQRQRASRKMSFRSGVRGTASAFSPK